MKYIRTVFGVEWDMFRCDLWAREMFYFFLCCCLTTSPNYLYNKIYLLRLSSIKNIFYLFDLLDFNYLGR